MRHVIPFAALLAVWVASPASAAPDAKAVFQQKCASCHTVGGGRTVGPDLKGVVGRREAAWVQRFILEPDQMITEGDAQAKALVAEFGMPMPATGVTQEEAAALVAMLRGGEVAAPTSAAAAPVPTPTQEAGPGGDATRGSQLFTGERALERGGPACISCHQTGEGALGGGTLAKDLTGLYGRLGPQGLKGALEGLPFPLMKDIYKDKGLSAQEVADLMAHFEAAEKASPGATPAGGGAFGLLGLAGAGALFLGMGLFWPRRRGPGVRKSLVGRK